VEEKTFELHAPFDLAMTFKLLLLWEATTWIKVDETGACYARRTVEGPGTVHIRHCGDHLLATAHGEGGPTVLEEVPEQQQPSTDPGSQPSTDPGSL